MTAFFLDRLYLRTLAHVSVGELKSCDEIKEGFDEEKFLKAAAEVRAALPLANDFRIRLKELVNANPDFKQIDDLQYAVKKMMNTWVKPWGHVLHPYCSIILRQQFERALSEIAPLAKLTQLGIDEYVIKPALDAGQVDGFRAKFNYNPVVLLFFA
jgi:hypothetical protein